MPQKTPRLPGVSHRTCQWANLTSLEAWILGSTSLGRTRYPASWALQFLPLSSIQPAQMLLHTSLLAQVCSFWGRFSRWGEDFVSGSTRGSTSSVSLQCLYVFLPMLMSSCRILADGFLRRGRPGVWMDNLVLGTFTAIFSRSRWYLRSMAPQTDKKVWKRSRYFHVTATTSARKWSIKTGPPRIAEHIDCVPTYEAPQLFRWKGYWAEIKRDVPAHSFSEEKGSHWARKLFLT